MQRTGILLVRMKTNDKKIFGRWFEVMTAGTADKVALYWYAEPSVLTHRSWCGDYTHTHACTRTASTQHSHKHMHPRTHATLTHTHSPEHTIHPHPRLYGDHSRLCFFAPQHAQHLNLQRGHRADRRRRPHRARECGVIWKQGDVTTAD